jgi:AraC-like DNA-binding protein
MQYLESRPKFPLHKTVHSLWQLEDKASSNPECNSVPPDGCVEIIFNLAEPFRRLHPNHRTELQPSSIFVGQMKHPTRIQPTGRVSLFGIRFQPYGASRFIDLPMNECCDQIVPLGEILNPIASEFEERIHLAASFSDRVRIAESMLLTLMKQESNSRIETAVEMIQNAASVDQIASHLGVSSRQLVRDFQREVGLTPKLLARIVRFQKIFQAIQYTPDSWASIAFDCGYYDQAHLIRDFQEFAGETPSTFLLQQHELTDRFTGRS